jgi:hypothetical protein
LEERKNCNFDQKELYELFHKDPEVRAQRERAEKDLADPVMTNTHKYYEWTPEEIQQSWMKKLNRAWHIDRHFYF